MVQLKPDSLDDVLITILTFQFHNGTIKTLAISDERLFAFDFNSIMVQLKHQVSPATFAETEISIP